MSLWKAFKSNHSTIALMERCVSSIAMTVPYGSPCPSGLVWLSPSFWWPFSISASSPWCQSALQTDLKILKAEHWSSQTLMSKSLLGQSVYLLSKVIVCQPRANISVKCTYSSVIVKFHAFNFFLSFSSRDQSCTPPKMECICYCLFVCNYLFQLLNQGAYRLVCIHHLLLT